MRELERYYRVLDLEPGASLEEVNQAYKDLAFIWHPDRIPLENQRLREKAQKKLQEINEAREK
ncbi:J domain-containing protein, partial [Fischerella thermalis]